MRRALRGQMRTTMARVGRVAVRRLGARARRFSPRDEVQALIEVHNEGMYPHREIGERLVERGDAGVVIESGAWLGETYYAVEFAARAVVVAMRASEMVKAARR
jgi:nitrogen fixation protein NifZ